MSSAILFKIRTHFYVLEGLTQDIQGVALGITGLVGHQLDSDTILVGLLLADKNDGTPRVAKYTHEEFLLAFLVFLQVTEQVCHNEFTCVSRLTIIWHIWLT